MADISLKKINIFNQLAESFNIKPDKNDVANDTSIFDIFKTADEDLNGVIEGAEVTSLYDELGLMNGQATELNKLIEEYNKLNQEVNAETVNLNETQQQTNNNNSNSSTDRTNNSSQTSSTGRTNNNNSRTTNTNNNSETIQKEDAKNFENMTLDQLKTEQSTKQDEIKAAEEKINEVFSGENAAVKSAIENEENAKLAYDELVEKAVQQEVITAELQEERATNLEAIKNQELTINTTKTDINNKESEINSENNNLSSAKSNLSALESALSSYDNSSDDEDDDSSSKKAKLQEQIRAEEENIRQIEENITKLENEKSELESKLSEEETVLSNLETERTRIDNEIMESCQKAEPELQMAMQKAQQEYNLSNANVDSIKVQEETNAKESLEIAKQNLDAVNSVYNKKNSSSIMGECGYSTSEMKDVVSYFGEDYLSVLSQEEIDNLIKKAKRNEMANIYPGKGSQCLGICYEYEKWVTGLSGKNHPFESESADTAVQKMAEVLNSGSPVIAKVNTKAGHRHFVLVIGIKQGASAPYQQSDFLCVDSYDGQVDGMGGSGNRDGNYRTLYAQNGKYWIGSRATTLA